MSNPVQVPRWPSMMARLLVAIGVATLVGASLAMLTIMCTTAYGMGNTVGERLDTICWRLGQPAGCSLKRVKSYQAEITVTIDDTVSEPGLPPQPGLTASTVTVRVKGVGMVSQTYARTDGQPVCLTAYCVAERQDDPTNYRGNIEQEMDDLYAATGKLLYQAADDPSLGARLATLLGTPANSVTAVGKVLSAATSVNATNDTGSVLYGKVRLDVYQLTGP